MLKSGAIVLAAAVTAAAPIPPAHPSNPPVPSAVEDSGAPHTNSQQRQDAPAADPRGTKQAPFVVQVIPTATTQHKATGEAGSENKPPSEDWWLIVPTILLAFFTGGLFAYTAKLWSATAVMARDAKKSSERQLRAYVTVKEIAPQADGLNPPQNILFPIILENTGQTPAYRTRNYVSWNEFPSGLPDPFFYWDIYPENRSEDSVFSMGPRQPRASTGITIPIGIIARLGQNQTHVFLWGWTEYDDVFQVRHRTEFCFSVHVIVKAPNSYGVTCAHHSAYNGMDDGCMKELQT